jgi:putative aminopeptidase FrvX
MYVAEANKIVKVAEEHNIPYTLDLGRGHTESKLKDVVTRQNTKVAVCMTEENWKIIDEIDK